MLRATAEFGHRNIVYPWLVSGEAQKDREIAHERALKALSVVERSSLLQTVLARLFTYKDPIIETQTLGLRFRNPLGVAAGFDKNARVFKSLAAFGFGHIEEGSITYRQSDGNPRPRIFALPEDWALINRMSFQGDGVSQCVVRLKENLKPKDQRDYIVGINIGASKPSFDNNTAIADYEKALVQLMRSTNGDYFVYNVSSPNTEGVRKLQDPVVLNDLLAEAKDTRDSYARSRPFLLKLSPDLTFVELDKILDVSLQHRIDGIILTNTTTDTKVKSLLRSKNKAEAGGVSGAPLTWSVTAKSEHVYKRTEGKLPIIRVGGIMDLIDYWNAISYGGAELVQVYTALVEQHTSSPALAYKMNKGLVAKLKTLGVLNVEELKGQRVPFYFDKPIKYPRARVLHH